MNFNAPHRRHTGRKVGRRSGSPHVFPCFAARRGWGGDKKPSDVTAPRSFSLGARPMAARGIGFLSHLFGLISAPSLQAEVNFMPGHWGGSERCCGQPSPSSLETGQQQQNLDRQLARVNASLAEERHRGSTRSQDRGRRKDTDEPPFPVRPSGVI